MLGACVGIAAVLYAAPKGYLGHPLRRGPVGSMTLSQSYASPMEQEVVLPPAVTTTVAEPTPAPVPAIQETVQPTPAPVQYAAPSVTPSEAPSVSEKPTRKHSRQTARVKGTAKVRRTVGSKASPKRKTKKR
ncbi:MAG: hypothetical protein ACLQEQ_07065 [Nitrososphaerales archaeon]